MTIYQQFENSIAAADQLVDMYTELRRSRGLGTRGRLDAANTDLLWLPRSAVVASLSAMDSYIHSVLYDRIPEVIREGNVPDPLAEALSSIVPIKNGQSFRAALPILQQADTVDALCGRLREKTLSFLSYQAPEKIIKGHEMIGYPNIFDTVAATWPGPRTAADDLRRTLANYVKRRNQIAHEGDLEASGDPRPMQPKYATDCRYFIENLVYRLDQAIYGL